ncbi:MAG TPA: FecR domain-containing protein [Planctomycetota bacterium]|nr:FecR domain-containing protein [Planctomycetota bacterium]
MSEDRDLLIERYLAGAASPEETKRLEALLRSDPRLVRDFVLALDEDVCLRALSSVEEERIERRSPLRRLAWRRSGASSDSAGAPWIAAAALVLTALLWTIFFASSPSRRPADKSAAPHAGPVELARPDTTPVPAPEQPGRQHPSLPRGERSIRPSEDAGRPVDPRPDTARRDPEPVMPNAPPPAKPRDEATGAPPVARPLDVVRPLSIDEIQGGVFVLDAGAKTPARVGQEILPSHGLLLSEAESRLTMTFPDGTKVTILGLSEIRDMADSERPGKGARGKRVDLVRGTLAAEVRKQPADQPMVIVTPQAQVQVVGTSFQLVVDGGEKGQTRLSVREGRVRLLRPGGKSADVAAGQEAAVAAGVDPIARPQDGSSVVLRPDLSLWLRADQGVMVNGTTVSQWSDRSGNGRHAVQAASARQPLYLRAAQAGRPALRFDGMDDFLSFPCPVTGLSGMTIFLVSSTLEERSGGVNGSGNAAVFWHEAENFGTVLVAPTPTKVRYFFGTGQNQAVFLYPRPASIDRAYSLTTVQKSGADAVLYIGGEEVFRQGGQKGDIASCEKVGQLGRGEGDKATSRQFQGQYEGWTYFAGEIAEVIVYSRALPITERVPVEQYLLSKYFAK